MIIYCLSYIFYLPFTSIEIHQSKGIIKLTYLKPRVSIVIPREDILGYEIYYYESERPNQPDPGLIFYTKEGTRYTSYVPSRETAGNIEKAVKSLEKFLPQLPSETSPSRPKKLSVVGAVAWWLEDIRHFLQRRLRHEETNRNFSDHCHGFLAGSTIAGTS